MAVPIATLQAAEIGRQLVFTQASPPNYTGATVKLLVTPPGSTTATQYTCAIVSNNPVYTTLGTEFPTPGKYSVQLEMTATGEKYYSPSATVSVLANLG